MATRVIHQTNGQHRNQGNVLNKACPSIKSRPADLSVQTDDQPELPRQATADKPPYRVPSMVDVAAIPWNGFTVASTFSGCGGSCLGYRMAGFKVVWANEFVPAAQDSYRANMSADAILDGRDIRVVQPEEILQATGLARGELDLFDGSPPCQAFSMAGHREKGWGQTKTYEHGAQQCNEKLYALDQQLAAATDADVIKGLQQKRQATVDLTQAEWNETDARAAKALDSPLDRYQDETAALKRQIGVLTANGKETLTYGQSVMVAAKQVEYFNKLTDETVAILLRSNKARDGAAAFFLDMQKQAKTTASIMYEALHSAFDKLSDNLTELITGGKTSFAAMFQDIGKQVLNSSIKQGLQKGLGALGAKLGIGLPKLQRLDGQTEAGALWVRLAAQLGGDTDPTKAVAAVIPALKSDQSTPQQSGGIGSSIIGFLGSLLGSLVGAKSGGGSGGESVTSSISYGGERAAGGPVTPDKAYLVNERGTEILMGASGTVLSNSQSRKMLEGAGGGNHYYSIDARGTDPVLTEQRTRAAIMAAHNSAIGNSVAVTFERLKRTPGR